MLQAKGKLGYFKICLILFKGIFFSHPIVQGADLCNSTLLLKVSISRGNGWGDILRFRKKKGERLWREVREMRRMCQSREQWYRSPTCPSCPTEATWVTPNVSGVHWWASGHVVLGWDEKFGGGLMLMLKILYLQACFPQSFPLEGWCPVSYLPPVVLLFWPRCIDLLVAWAWTTLFILPLSW